MEVELGRLCGVDLYSPQRESSDHVRVFMAKHPRGSLNTITPSLSLEGATRESKSIHSTLSSICKKVRLPSGSWWDAAISCDSPNTSRRLALGCSDVCLVGENPTHSVPVL